MNKKVVLIVDDEPVNINIVAQILIDNYIVRVANSGELALDIIRQKKPDLILLDVVMPNMDGFEVATILKADESISNVPFIFLTGKNDSQSIVDGFKHGAVDYISKPFSKEELLARVHTHLKLNRLQKSLAKSVISLENKIDELEKSKKELKDAQSKITHYVELMDKNVISSSTDLDGFITDVSEAFCKISGYSKDELIGNRHSIVRHDDMSEDIYINLWDTITKDEIWIGDLKNRRKDGTHYWAKVSIFPDFDDKNEKIGYTAIRENITDKKKIEEISIKDELTNLYNRRYFNTIFPKELNRAKRDSRDIAFLMLDIDHFKLYNDNYGHQEGDNVLATIGEALNRCCKRSSDFCFRLGGEEFGIIISEQSLQESIDFANNIRETIENLAIPHTYSLSSDIITVSIGLIFKDKSIDIDMHKLYKLADDNLYRAKENGRNRVELEVLSSI